MLMRFFLGASYFVHLIESYDKLQKAVECQLVGEMKQGSQALEALSLGWIIGIPGLASVYLASVDLLFIPRQEW